MGNQINNRQFNPTTRQSPIVSSIGNLQSAID